MKTLILIFSIIVSTALFAQPNPDYKINSQYLNSSVSGDSILITGMVHYEKTPGKDSFGKISSLDFRSTAVVARDGSFQIMIHKSSKGIYFFQNGYKEIIIDFSQTNQYNCYVVNINGEKLLSNIRITGNR